MDRNLPPNPIRCNDAVSQELKLTNCSRIDFLVESRTYENLLKVIPPFAPKCSMFEDGDPWKVTVWTTDTPAEIKATLVELRDLLVPEGYREMGMPRHIGALAYVKLNNEPAFPELSIAMETIRRASDPGFWKGQVEQPLRETVLA